MLPPELPSWIDTPSGGGTAGTAVATAGPRRTRSLGATA